MRKRSSVISFCLLFILLLNIVKATTYINDFTNNLEQINIDKLKFLSMHIKEETGISVYIFLVDNINIINETNEEMTISIVHSINNKKTYITISDELNNKLTNEEVDYLKISSQPLFNNEKYYEGFRHIVNEVQMEIGAGGQGNNNDNIQEGTDEIWKVLGIIFITLIILFFILSIALPDKPTL